MIVEIETHLKGGFYYFQTHRNKINQKKFLTIFVEISYH